MAVLTYLGALNATDRAAVAPMANQPGMTDYLPVQVVGAGVYLAGRICGAVLGPLVEADEDDDLGLQRMIRWVEDLWGGLGPMALVGFPLIVFPLLTVAAFGLAVLILVLIERRLEARGGRAKVPCGHCGEPIHASAPTCPHCHLPVQEPRDVGLLGHPRD